MQHIETVTVGSGGAASITFMAVGDIPSEYTDLLVVFSGRSTQTDFPVTDVLVNFNSTGANLSQRNLRGYGGGVTSQTRTDLLLGNMPSSSNTANTFSNGAMYVPNYRASAAKSVSVDSVSETGNAGTFDWWVNIHSSLWNDTSPITSIGIAPSGGHNFVQYTSASLYGITAGSDGIVAVS